MLKDTTKEDTALVTLSGEVFSVLPVPAPRLTRVAPPKLLVPARVKRTKPAAKSLVYQVLKGARDIIADPKRWTKHAFARDAHGRATSGGVYDDNATSFCAIGAIYRSAFNLTGQQPVYQTGDNVARQAVRLVTPAGRHDDYLIHMNDMAGRDAVLAIFDARLEKINAA